MNPELNVHVKSYYLNDPIGTPYFCLYVLFMFSFLNTTANDLVKLTDEARCIFLLARIYQKTKESEDTAQAFIKARDVQARYCLC